MGNLTDRMELVDGLWWPKEDRECRKYVTSWMVDLEYSLPLVKEKVVAVQAGGNVGTWPLHLGSVFQTVYTFEPDALNFQCLVQNCPQENIIKMQAGLGDQRGTVDMVRDRRNVGAHYISGSGSIPILCIDDLVLPRCDFICLDVEGYEWKALRGAATTLGLYKPVIHLEDKGLSDKYGSSKGDVVKWLIDEYGYEIKHEVHRDFILA